jgi:hypothetical protein
MTEHLNLQSKIKDFVLVSPITHGGIFQPFPEAAREFVPSREISQVARFHNDHSQRHSAKSLDFRSNRQLNTMACKLL